MTYILLSRYHEIHPYSVLFLKWLLIRRLRYPEVRKRSPAFVAMSTIWRKAMNLMKRWKVHITSSFDRIVSQIENHEALVECAIREVHASTARASARLNQVQRDGQNIRAKLARLHQDSQKWQHRAAQIADQDRQRALECLRRRNRIEREITGLEIQEREHRNLENNLANDLKKIEEKLEDLARQRNLLRTRQSRAETMRLLEGDNAELFTDVDDIFDRWESKVCEYEYRPGWGHAQRDELEETFLNQEEEESLQAELERLLSTFQQNS